MCSSEDRVPEMLVLCEPTATVVLTAVNSLKLPWTSFYSAIKRAAVIIVTYGNICSISSFRSSSEISAGGGLFMSSSAS